MLTYVLIGINVLFFLGSRSNVSAYFDLVLAAGPVADGDVWRPLTGAFLHARGSFGFIHIGFNMYLLYILGSCSSRPRQVALRRHLLRVGVHGRVRRDPAVEPDCYTVGALGAVFGLMGAGVVFLRARGVDPMALGLGPTILINLAFPFLFPGLNVSIGGHLGGLIGGALAGYAVAKLSERRSSPVLPVLACFAIGAVGLVGTYFEARMKIGL